MSELHTGELNCDFSYIIIICCVIFLTYFNTIATGRMWNISEIFIQFGFSDSELTLVPRPSPKFFVWVRGEPVNDATAS